MHRRSTSALAALAVGTIPVPLHAISAGRHQPRAAPARAPSRSPHRPIRHVGRARHPAAGMRGVVARRATHAPARTTHARAGHRTAHRSRGHGTAHLARDPAETISDFQFAPTTITVHVGDTITWTNDGPSSHTATAADGSFDTGVLHKGASASHTFTQAGSFAYVCQIHPFMHGTVVVLAAASPSRPSPSGPRSGGSGASSTSGDSGANGSAGAAPGSSGASTGQGSSTGAGQALPATGLDLVATALAGATLLGAGTAVRRRGYRGRRGAA